MSLSRRGAPSHPSSPSSTTSLRSGGALGRNGFATVRSSVLAAARLAFIPLVSAAPLFKRGVNILEDDEDLPKDPSDPDLYIYLGVAIALVLLGGVFAGLTIALMGQDETYLQVIATSGEGSEKKHAESVLKLLKKGKHWVLVTLLLSNVITNETLPIVLDRSLGGGWPAVLSSTVLIVIFGEIAPQSVCVRYGLSIGAFMAPFVWVLMLIMCPVAWPTAKLLDYLLGEDHGTFYKKSGLKTLVQLHKTLGITGERLMEDEVTIINSVLDLKDKPVGNIMTPMQDVFTMSAETVLDEKMMDTILSQGYSRIPIYAPDNPKNFIGMLLVKILITYDPEDCKRVRDFALATLPETAPETSCLDIINFFQEGKSHMVLVSDFPGQDKGAMGVVTLEDVIEELIGEEIIDESDVFVDIHKAIRRMAPAPRTRYNKNGILTEPIEPTHEHDDDKSDREDAPLLGQGQKAASERKSSLSNGGTTFLMRRKSSAASENQQATVKPTPVRSNTMDLRKHLSHLGPSNAASKPRATKFQSVKIKPGVGTIPESHATTTGTPSDEPVQAPHVPGPNAPDGGEGAGLLKSAGKDASDGVKTLPATYGTMSGSPPQSSHLPQNEEEEIVAEGVGSPRSNRMTAHEASQMAEEHTEQPPADEPSHSKDTQDNKYLSPYSNAKKMVIGSTESLVQGEENDTVGDMDSSTRERSTNRRAARSGSITETTIDVNGMKKVVLEANSSSSEENEQSSRKMRSNDASAENSQYDGSGNDRAGQASGGKEQAADEDGQKKKSKKKRGCKKKKAGKGAGKDGEGA
ncbi:hypothetical protein MBLNU230_g2812t1 [Neophaeotheca triangularis]